MMWQQADVSFMLLCLQCRSWCHQVKKFVKCQVNAQELLYASEWLEGIIRSLVVLSWCVYCFALQCLFVDSSHRWQNKAAPEDTTPAVVMVMAFGERDIAGCKSLKGPSRWISVAWHSPVLIHRWDSDGNTAELSVAVPSKSVFYSIFFIERYIKNNRQRREETERVRIIITKCYLKKNRDLFRPG